MDTQALQLQVEAVPELLRSEQGDSGSQAAQLARGERGRGWRPPRRPKLASPVA